jgi:hypothetical protein
MTAWSDLPVPDNAFPQGRFGPAKPAQTLLIGQEVNFMKTTQVSMLVFAALAAVATPVAAQTTCAASAGIVRLSNAQISTLLTGRTVCGVPGTNYPGSPSDRFQEEHLANGELWDYKRGPGHPVDPREKVGTWAVNQGVAGVQGMSHRYGTTLQFNWTVFGPATNVPGTSVYLFCSGAAEHIRATVIATGSGCASFPTGASAPRPFKK